MKPITLRLPDEMYRDVYRAAGQSMTNKCEYIRNAIKKALDADKKKQEGGK